jgi:hypothetical protein
MDRSCLAQECAESLPDVGRSSRLADDAAWTRWSGGAPIPSVRSSSPQAIGAIALAIPSTNSMPYSLAWALWMSRLVVLARDGAAGNRRV